MNPTKYIFSVMTLISLATIQSQVEAREGDAESQKPLNQMVTDGKGGFVLDELVVRRQANVDDVLLEDDGSFSLLSSDPSVLFSALNSGAGAAVNFELSFARHSIVMTADGQQTLDGIARALTLIGKSSAFQLIVHRYGNQDPKGRKKLTESRANEVLGRLKGAYGISSLLALEYTAKSAPSNTQRKESNAIEVLGFTVVNMGESTIFSVNNE